jgi:hypothetical protein
MLKSELTLKLCRKVILGIRADDETDTGDGWRKMFNLAVAQKSTKYYEQSASLSTTSF